MEEDMTEDERDILNMIEQRADRTGKFVERMMHIVTAIAVTIAGAVGSILAVVGGVL